MTPYCSELFRRSGLSTQYLVHRDLTKAFESWLECDIRQSTSLFSPQDGIEIKYWDSFVCTPEHLTYIMMKPSLTSNEIDIILSL